MSRWALFVLLFLSAAIAGALLSEEIGRQLAIVAIVPLVLAMGLAMESAIDHGRRKRRPQ